MSRSKQQHFVPKNAAQLKVFLAMAAESPRDRAAQQMFAAVTPGVRSARAADLHALMRDHDSPQMELNL